MEETLTIHFQVPNVVVAKFRPRKMLLDLAVISTVQQDGMTWRICLRGDVECYPKDSGSSDEATNVRRFIFFLRSVYLLLPCFSYWSQVLLSCAWFKSFFLVLGCTVLMTTNMHVCGYPTITSNISFECYSWKTFSFLLFWRSQILPFGILF